MANKLMRRCSTPFIIKEIQRKTTMKYHYIPSRVAKIQNIGTTKSWWWQSNMNSLSLLVGYKIVQSLWMRIRKFLTKPNILLSHDPVIKLLGIYPKELDIYVHTKTCTQMFIAALFIIPKLRSNQDVCPSEGEWINCGTFRQWILFSAKKKWAIKPWRDKEEPTYMLLNERSQGSNPQPHGS